MRKNLLAGLGKAFSELRGATLSQESVARTERYMSSKTVFALIGCTVLVMCVLYVRLSGLVSGGIAAALVMLIVGFFFATVSGYLVGVIGSSNNPISGLTLSTLVIAALLMVSMGVSGMSGVVAVLGVAAVVCVSSAVAGELLQDFKVGYILGGTPRYIQITELIAVVVASLVMYFPLMILYQGNINMGGTGFGDKALSAPQAARSRHCWRRNGVASGHCGHPDGRRHDYVQSKKPHAGCHWHVPAVRNYLGNFCRRSYPLAHGPDPRSQRFERRTEGTR